MHKTMIEIIAEKYNITVDESARLVRDMSFKEYNSLLEATVDGANVPSPSGLPQIGGNPQNTSPVITPTDSKIVPTGASQPNRLNAGNTVTIKDEQGRDVEYQVVDRNPTNKTLKLKNTVTGKESEHNEGDIGGPIENPFTRSLAAAKNVIQQGMSIESAEQDSELNRLLELAGMIHEDASCGATGAGSIATASAGIGKMQKRYKPAEEASTGNIHGKITPNAATGELSRRLADAGKKTASRKNNGKKVV